MTTATKSKPRKTIKAAKPRKPKAPLTPQDEAILEIGRASQIVTDQAEKRKEDANEILKGAKADHLEAVRKLQAIIAEYTTPNLFNQKVAKPSLNGHANAAEAPDAWKAEPLSVLRDLGGLSQADLDRVEAKTELRTMGDLSKWLTDDRNHFINLPGIGKSKVEKLEDAMEKFWAKHPNASNTGAKAAADAVVNDVAATTELPAAEEAK